MIHSACFRTRTLLLAVFGNLALISTGHSDEAKDISQGCIAIGFDDSYLAVHRDALPLFKKHKLVGTAYITTGVVGQPGYMSWPQIKELQKNGWEIGAHSDTHAMYEKVPLSEAHKETLDSIVRLKRNGIRGVRSFAFPYGSYTWPVIADLAKSISHLRGYVETGLDPNEMDSMNPDLINGTGVTRETPVEKVQAWIEQAKKEKECISLVFHDLTSDDQYTGSPHHVRDDPGDCAPDYGELYPLSKFDRVLQLVQDSGLPNVTDAELARLQGKRVLSPALGGNESSWTLGQGVRLDRKGNGEFPTTKDSALFESGKGGVQPQELSSRKVEASSNPQDKYIFEAYFNTVNMAAGSMAVDVHEFDKNKKEVRVVNLGEVEKGVAVALRKPYSPSSPEVSSFQIVIHPIGYQGKVFVDNPTMTRQSGPKTVATSSQ